VLGGKVLIENNSISDSIDQGHMFVLPAHVKVKLEEGSLIYTAARWNTSKVDTSKAGTYDFNGYLEGYNSPIKMTLKVLSSNKNSNSLNWGFTATKGDWVYYMNPANGDKLSKAKLDGSSVTKLSDDNSAFINLVGDYIYYCNYLEDGAIYKISTDGTNRTKISSDFAYMMQVADGWIFYQDSLDSYRLYRMDLNGNNKVRISDDMPADINIYKGYIYYSNLSNYGEIVRINLDGSGRVNINDEYSSCLSIANDWIYYQNEEDYKALYKVKINGTGRIRIKSEIGIDFNVVDSWIYYSNINDNNKLYRLSTDGTKNERLTDFAVSKINVSGNRLFFLDRESGVYLFSLNLNKTGLVWFGVDTKIALVENMVESVGQGDSYSFPEIVTATMSDGSKLLYEVKWDEQALDTTKLGIYSFKGHIEGYDSDINLTVNIVERGNSNANLSRSGAFAEKDGFVYFNNVKNYKLYKIKSDGTSKSFLSDDHPSFIQVIGNWVYYLNKSDGDKLYKINVDGTGRTSVSDDSMSYVNIVGDWVYYSNSSDYNYLYKMKFDGSSKTKLSSENVYKINTMGDWLYYISATDNNRLYKMKKDGTQRTLLYEYSIDNLIVSGSKIYLSNSSWYSMDLDGRNMVKIDLGAGVTSDISVDGDKVYYSNQNTYSRIYVKDTITGLNKKLSSTYASGIHILGNYIYYTNEFDSGKIYRINKDGSEEKPFGMDNNITSIEEVVITVKQYEKYSLPQKIFAVNSDLERILVSVAWNSNIVDTSKLGSTFYEGTVTGYANKVKLTLNVVDKELEGNTTGNISNDAFAAQNSNWVFINNYRMKPDGSQKSKYTEDYAGSINVIGDWVFYTNTDSIIKINQDGTKKTVICTDSTRTLSVVGDWVYYINKDDGEALYKIRISGLDKTKVIDERILSLTVSNGWIYYTSYNNQLGTDNFYKIKTDGTGKIKLDDGFILGVNVVGDWIYYQSDYNTVSKMKTDGTSKTYITSVTQWCDLNYSGGWLYFEKDYRLAKAKSDGTGFSYLTPQGEQPVTINVLGDWVYYYATNGYTYRVKSDGTSKQLIY
jgi:hypothetical protein